MSNWGKPKFSSGSSYPKSFGVKFTPSKKPRTPQLYPGKHKPSPAQKELLNVIPEPPGTRPEVIRWRDEYIARFLKQPRIFPMTLWAKGKRPDNFEFLGFGRFLAWFEDHASEYPRPEPIADTI